MSWKLKTGFSIVSSIFRSLKTTVLKFFFILFRCFWWWKNQKIFPISIFCAILMKQAIRSLHLKTFLMQTSANSETHEKFVCLGKWLFQQPFPELEPECCATRGGTGTSALLLYQRGSSLGVHYMAFLPILYQFVCVSVLRFLLFFHFFSGSVNLFNYFSENVGHTYISWISILYSTRFHHHRTVRCPH